MIFDTLLNHLLLLINAWISAYSSVSSQLCSLIIKSPPKQSWYLQVPPHVIVLICWNETSFLVDFPGATGYWYFGSLFPLLRSFLLWYASKECRCLFFFLCLFLNELVLVVDEELRGWKVFCDDFLSDMVRKHTKTQCCWSHVPKWWCFHATRTNCLACLDKIWNSPHKNFCLALGILLLLQKNTILRQYSPLKLGCFHCLTSSISRELNR